MVIVESSVYKSVNVILYGLSIDTKPIGTFQGQEIPNGAKFIEMDTRHVFFYDKEGERWL